MSDDFTRGWHDGYRAARHDAMSVLGYGPAGRDVISRIFDWADGHPPEPQAVAWMRDFLIDRPYVDPIDICDYYRQENPASDLSNKVLTESYMAAREARFHRLKTWPAYFRASWVGTKTFELRKDDRDFRVGDRVVLYEYDPDEHGYTGVSMGRTVTYVLRGPEAERFGLKPGYCILGLADAQEDT